MLYCNLLQKLWYYIIAVNLTEDAEPPAASVLILKCHVVGEHALKES